MNSIWDSTVTVPTYPALHQNITVDAAVIGGGIAGLLIAYQLEKRGIHAVVLERDRIWGGQTHDTTAKITAQHGICYHPLIQNYGEEKAAQYAAANQAAIHEFRTLIQKGNIPCEWEEVPSYLYTTMDEALLEKEALAAARVGLDSRFTTDTSLPFPIKAALCFPGQAQFNPLLFLQALLPSLTIYEKTPVLSIEKQAVSVPGATVQARHIILACHYPFPRWPGFYFLRMHQERSYVLALREADQVDGMYYGIDSDGLSFRNSGSLLLLGGAGHRTGKRLDQNPYQQLWRQAQLLYPNCEQAARWSAQDCMPLDGITYIGTFSPTRPNWYVATGFHKWGMTTSMAAAMILTGMILGEPPAYSGVFSPRRFSLKASKQNLKEDIRVSVKSLSRQFFTGPKKSVDDLLPGQAGIVRLGGRKVAAYRDESDRLYHISAKCPHLGCQLEWNPAERSWDCPCHGSRFDYTGKLLDSPAKSNVGGQS